MKMLLIITGSDGLLGSTLLALTKKKNIEAIGISRSSIERINIARYQGRQIDLSTLNSDKISFLKNKSTRKIIINCAWSGLYQLTDGEIQDQLSNLIFIEDLLHFSELYYVRDIVNIGSMDELVVERSIFNGKKLSTPYFSHNNYGLAKLAARDVLKFFCYTKKVNLLHAKLSIMVDPLLEKGNFVEKNLKSILAGEEYEIPNSQELYNISTSTYIAKQIIEIVTRNYRSHDLVLGSGLSMTLKAYFQAIANFVQTKNIEFPDSCGDLLLKTDFYIPGHEALKNSETFLSLVKELQN